MISPLHLARLGFTNANHLRQRIAEATLAGAAHDFARAARLMIRDPEPRPAPARAERVVVTLSSVPHRRSHLVPTLRSLVDQICPPDRIVLAWPEHSLRTLKPYPRLPHIPAGVEVIRCADEGPATKLLPALRAEPDAVVVVVDDDHIYPDTFLEDLLAAHRSAPTSTVGLRGYYAQNGSNPDNFPHVCGTALRQPRAVDVLMGMWGYLIPPGSLDEGYTISVVGPPKSAGTTTSGSRRISPTAA
ncbi:glycosyltransferase [Nocardia sp. NPDC051570]|uniref:glycosyltransferase n=1 Tax=Nocardia sp. NPDC051570 TaxID=3364324 RepID=UPI00379FEFF5